MLSYGRHALQLKGNKGTPEAGPKAPFAAPSVRLGSPGRSHQGTLDCAAGEAGLRRKSAHRATDATVGTERRIRPHENLLPLL
jgi:hypothetical protein